MRNLKRPLINQYTKENIPITLPYKSGMMKQQKPIKLHLNYHNKENENLYLASKHIAKTTPQYKETRKSYETRYNDANNTKAPILHCLCGKCSTILNVMTLHYILITHFFVYYA